ncbi:hypothetical protein H5410_063941 [Solanum commersonii]|uniref:Leucine-rich repeat-containing N-terminal plant-type domain-containing protein n=1 Tax=Solanum commersonii TaxID=4109 RepID=A0A9J5WFQ0_SOLCO|nr:hypothetical protein H5410_063941 [Solanum commersonii]
MGSRDCCSWDGVVCDDITGHVIELDLSCSNLTGTIDSNSSLFQLSHLQRLDLSSNNFSNSHISPEFGKFSSLKHLHLSHSYFSGQIPSEISHLSKLHTLRLSTIDDSKKLRLATHDFKSLLQNLTQLRELDLSGINISSTIPLNFSSHLTTLNLIYTGLYGIIPESIFHLPNLETLDLSDNDHLNGYFPKTKWNSSASLIELDLSRVNFSCNLPESLGYHLTSLDDEESNSEFLSDFRKAAFMGYGSGLCIGISIVYFMMSTGKPIWFARIIVELEHKIMMGRRKKQRRQRNCRRRNNH